MTMQLLLSQPHNRQNTDEQSQSWHQHFHCHTIAIHIHTFRWNSKQTPITLCINKRWNPKHQAPTVVARMHHHYFVLKYTMICFTNIIYTCIYTHMTVKYKNNKRATPKKINILNLYAAKGQENSKIMYTLSRTSVVGLMSTQIGGNGSGNGSSARIARCTQSFRYQIPTTCTNHAHRNI